MQRGAIIPKDPSIPQTLKFAEDLYELYEFKDVEELTEDSFFIKKVDDQTIMDIMFILSSHEHLVKFLRSRSCNPRPFGDRNFRVHYNSTPRFQRDNIVQDVFKLVFFAAEK